MTLFKEIDRQIVHDSSPFIQKEAELHLARVLVGEVPAQGELEEVEGLLALNLDFAHVANIEQPRLVSRLEVFVDDTGILDGHGPAAKIDDFCPERDVTLIQRCFFHSPLSGCRDGPDRETVAVAYRFWKRFSKNPRLLLGTKRDPS